MTSIFPAASPFFFAVLFFFQPLFAVADDEKGGQPEWVLSYFLVLLCLGLSVLVLLRPCNRSETAFTQEELDNQKAEDLKKMTEKH